MAKRTAPKKAIPKRRAGTAFWLSDTEGAMVRAIAAAEDRTIQAVLRRALAAYAERSPEYQKSVAGRS